MTYFQDECQFKNEWFVNEPLREESRTTNFSVATFIFKGGHVLLIKMISS